ncbi:hypothetical protein [Pseudomonas phage UF_RH7]|nr:hypothetical protein [Pseudomonas phage UF_RH7]
MKNETNVYRAARRLSQVENLEAQPVDLIEVASTFEWLQKRILQQNINAGWWKKDESGQLVLRNKGETLMLIVSEIVEAFEGERKGLMDDHLPHRKMPEVELADAIIRILDYAAAHGYDVGGALIEKWGYNVDRADHKPENREKEGGKKF